MAGLPACSGKDAVRAFERLGYRIVRQKGSHVIMKHEGRSSLTVPLEARSREGRSAASSRNLDTPSRSSLRYSNPPAALSTALAMTEAAYLEARRRRDL